MVVVACRKLPTLNFTYLFFFIVFVSVNSTTPLGILLRNTNTESKPQTCHIKDNDSTAVQEAENIIKNFISNGSRNDTDGDEFHIHGWKWHTMSLIYEARRLSHIAATLHDRNEQNLQRGEASMMNDSSDILALRTVADYTIDFNMRGLHRIENEVFFPMLRQRISSPSSSSSVFRKMSGNDNEIVTAAITTVLNQLDKDRKAVELMGTSVMKDASIAASSLESWDSRTLAIEKVAKNAAAIADSTQAMLSREIDIVIPVVARLFTESEQKALNNQVIRKLGILDSRLHLVGLSLIHI